MDLFERLAHNPVLQRMVRARRRLRGPKRPTWNEELEIAAAFMRLYGPTLMRLSAKNQRRGAERLLRPGPIMAQTTREAVRLGSLQAEWFSPAEVDHEGVVLFLHGGGFVIGSPSTHQNLVAAICRESGCRALVPAYRLAPEHPFPAALEDAERCYRHLLERMPANRVVLAGDSAGGGLAIATLLRIRALGLPQPAGAAAISPWVDLTHSAPSIARGKPYDYIIAPHLAQCANWYLAGHDPRDPLVSPLFGSLEGLPPLLIQAGGAESLIDDATRLAARAEADGVQVTLDVVEDMLHVFHIFSAVTPEPAAAFERLGAFVRARCSA